MFTCVHALVSYAGALPNRDADGLAKRLVYGGVERQRVSSQCLKAALRSPASGMPALAERLDLGLALRSRLIFPKVVRPLLLARGMDEAAADAWLPALAGLFLSGEAKAPEGGVLDQPIVLGQRECAALADVAALLHGEGVKPATKDIVRAAKAHAPALEALRDPGATGLDGALFGRFSTADMVDDVDGAVHVAHLIGTHPIQSTTDFFTVQDTLSEAHGGSHMNTSELVSGVLYGFVVVDLRQLDRNFAGLTPEQRGGIVGWLVQALARAEPAAKRGSTAPYHETHEIAVEVSDRQPISGVGAFEEPCAPTSAAAVAALRAHLARLDRRFGAPARRLWLTDMDEAAGERERPSLDLLAAETARLVAEAATPVAETRAA